MSGQVHAPLDPMRVDRQGRPVAAGEIKTPWWRPRCVCGWNGMDRPTEDDAQDAANRHVNRQDRFPARRLVRR